MTLPNANTANVIVPLKVAHTEAFPGDGGAHVLAGILFLSLVSRRRHDSSRFTPL